MNAPPLLPVAFFFAMGIAVGKWAAPSYVSVSLCLVIYSVLFACKRSVPSLFYWLVFLFGIWRVGLACQKDTLDFPEGKSLCKVRAVVTRPPYPERWFPRVESDRSHFYKNSFLVHVHSIYARDDQGRTEWTQHASGVKVVSLETNLRLMRGDEVEMFGWLSPIPPPSNVGQKETLSFWESRGVSYHLLVQPGNIVLLRRGQGGWMRNFFHGLRMRYIEFLLDHLGQEDGTFLAAILLGSRKLIDPEIEANFRRCGVSHLLAISGFHVALVAFLFYRFIKWACFPVPVCNLSVMAICGFYALLTELDPPVVRAVLVIWTYLAAPLFGRKPSSLNALALAALVVLGHSPMHLFQAGFQLSFAASFCILRTLPHFHPQEKKKASSWVKKMAIGGHNNLMISFAAWIGTSPLVAAHFYSICPLSPLTTLLLTPFFVLSLALGLLLLFTLIGIGWGALFLVFALHGVLWAIKKIVEIGASCSFAFFPILPPLPLYLCIFYAYLFLFDVFSPERRRFFGVLFLIVLGSGFLRPMLQRENPLTVLDVGDGNAIYLRLSGNKNMLYDCGSMTPSIGSRVILPFLMHCGVRHLDSIVLSHYDSDHYNAVREIMEYVRIRRIFINRKFAENGESLLRGFRERGIAIVEVKNKQPMSEVNGVTFLYPAEGSKMKSDNEHSLMLLYEFRGKNVLLTADVGSRALRKFLEKDPPLVDLLQVPHHGRTLSATRSMLLALKPSQAFISGGKNALSPSVSHEYSRLGIRVWPTFRYGGLEIFISKNLGVTPFHRILAPETPD